MLIAHKLSLDLLEPVAPEPIQVKQGDTLSRCLEISLFSGGEAWMIPGGVYPLVRWTACDLSTGKTASGIYNTLPGGSPAWLCAENQVKVILVPQMFALPGTVRADVVLIQGNKTLATFDFEFYVNPVPANGTEPQVQNYYKIATLDQINTAIADMQQKQADQENILARLERKLDVLARLHHAEITES